VIVPFCIGFLLGLGVVFFKPLLKLIKLRMQYPLGEDEHYLLRAARTSGGRLIVRKETSSTGASIIVLKELPDAKRLDNTGQLECLAARNLIIPDSSGVAGRYVLTSQGWAKVKHLPALALPLRRTGAWFNSISRQVKPLSKRPS